MVKIYQSNVKDTLDEIAPIKTNKIRSNYKFGLSDSTRKLIADRICTRNRIRNAKKNEKVILMAKYKILRNKVKWAKKPSLKKLC